MDKPTQNDYLQWWSDPITKEFFQAVVDRQLGAVDELLTCNAESLRGYQKTVEEMSWAVGWIDDKIKPQGGINDANG